MQTNEASDKTRDKTRDIAIARIRVWSKIQIFTF